MPASFVNNGDGTITIKYEYTAETQKVQDTIVNAAAYEYLVGDDRIPWIMDGDERVPYDQLSNQQKLDITFHRIKFLLLDEAKTGYINAAVESARETAESEADDIHLPPGTQSA